MNKTDTSQWDEAQAALEAAQKMPGGEARVEALKRAGLLRFQADEHRRKIEKTETE